MSRFTIYILLSFIIVCFLSCEKNQQFSCDPAIDGWVKTNISEIQGMNKSEITKKELAYQRAMFRACLKTQKAKLWKDKLDEVMQLDWSTQELEHLKLLRTSINADWFDDNTKKDSIACKYIKTYLNEWIKNGQEKFGWTKKLCIGMVGRLDKLKDKQGNIDSPNETAAASTPCGCSQESDWCDGDETCAQSLCLPSVDGCGTLWWHPCDGKCI